MKPKLLLIFVLLLLFGCAKTKLKNYEYSDFIFGSYLRVSLWTIDSLQAKVSFDKIMQELYHIDSVASSFNPQSEVSQLNKKHSLIMSADLKALITKSIEVSEKSNGAFDITVGSVMKSWGFYGENQKSNIKNEKLTEVVDYKKIRFDGDSIFLPPNMIIDLGGIAVGYALDKVVAKLKANGIKQGLIDAGGDIVGFGEKVYTIGIKNPKAEGIVKTIKIKNQAISTSGNYEKYIEKDNEQYTHIINPKTKQAINKTSQGLNSVTIIAERCVDADAYATAVFVLGLEDGEKLVRKLRLQAVLISENGKMIEIK